MKKHFIFDLDGTLIKSMSKSLDIVFDILKNIPGTDLELTRYVFYQTLGKPLKKQLELIYPYKDEKFIDDLTNKIYDELSKLESDFFSGAIETIKYLANKGYKLYLTTGNSTQTALKYLKKGGIDNLFSAVLGSDKILKGPEHLEYFKEISQDPNFYENAIYVGDGNSDRIFANEKGITFIHIGNEKKDQYEIEHISQLIDFLKKEKLLKLS